MKQLLLCIVVLIFVQSARSQVYIDGRNINADTAVHYIEVIHNTHPSSFYIESIDIGEWKKNFTDSAGKKLNLGSFVAMLTYMNKNGWVLVRRDFIFETRRSDYSFGGYTHAFVLFERANTAPAH